MLIFEWIVAASFGAIVLAALARRLGIPYPALLALGGVALSFVPAVPNLRLDPDLALALFVAPVLLHAGLDTSLRDLKAQWRPILGLAIGAVLVTIVAVAVVAKAIVPEMPWAACIVLGAIIAPPDAVAALSVLRQVSMPHRLVTILRGESLLNDAGTLLVYRLGVAAAVQGGSESHLPPAIAFLGIAASLLVGPALGRLSVAVQNRITDSGTAIVLQFASGFAIWLLAERIGLSGVLTLVTYALTIARYAPEIATPRARVVQNAVWDTAVFALNVFAFVLIGIQIEPALQRLGGQEQVNAFVFASAIFATVVVVRLAWALAVSGIREVWIGDDADRRASGPWPRPALAVAWSGMRGIVTIATALALPDGFPQRDLIVVCAFGVVIGTLVIQGATLRPLLKVLALTDDDPVGRETGWARARAYEAALRSLDASPEADEAVAALRSEFAAALDEAERERDGLASEVLPADAARRRAVAAAREAVIALRRKGEIGDDAFYRLEEELDWAELSASSVEDRAT